MALSEIYNYLQHDDWLASAGQPTAEQLAEVAMAGFQAVINLGMTDSDYALPDEAGLVTSLGMDYIHIPVVWSAPNQENLQAFYRALEQLAGKKVFVHCAANFRATAFIALYRIQKLGWPPSRAWEMMRQIWEPDEVWSNFITRVLSEPTS